MFQLFEQLKTIKIASKLFRERRKFALSGFQICIDNIVPKKRVIPFQNALLHETKETYITIVIVNIGVNYGNIDQHLGLQWEHIPQVWYSLH